MSLVEIAWICAVLKAPTTALESAANCVELNAPICAVCERGADRVELVGG